MGTMRFKVGDAVRVSGLSNSQWRGFRGVIVEVVQRTTSEDDPGIEECGVRFAGEPCCWLLAKDLTKAPPEKLVRFFRYEVLERWKQLDPNGVNVLNGDRAELIMFLQEDCGFVRRRAEAEVDEFLRTFYSRLKSATAPQEKSDSVAA